MPELNEIAGPTRVGRPGTAALMMALLLVAGCGEPSAADAGHQGDGGAPPSADGSTQPDMDGSVPSDQDGGGTHEEDASTPIPPAECDDATPVDVSSLDACSFGLDEVAAGSTTAIDCLLDLEGETVTLPSGASLTFDGGTIRNGGVVLDGGTIDGALLNHELEVSGDGSLSDPTFVFIPEHWDVVQGEVSLERAVANKEGLSVAIERASSLGANVFDVNTFDAFFAGDVYDTHPPTAYESNGIRLVSNLHLRMCDETFLRMQPTNNPMARLLMTYRNDDVTISGGHLIGDRYTHDYSPVDDDLGVSRDHHGLSYAIMIHGGSNITIDGVHVVDSSSDAITVGGSSIRNTDGTPRPGHPPATNIIIRNCTLDASRRNGISVLDADGVLIEGNVITNTGGGEPEGPFDFGPQGVAPEIGIDLEAYREREPDGTLREYERVENVTIRDNNFTGNAVADILVYTAHDVLLEQNRLDNRIGIFASHHVTIQDNDLVQAVDGPSGSAGIGVSKRVVEATGEDLNHDIDIIGNRVADFDMCLSIGSVDVTVADNVLTNCQTGIFMKTLENGVFTNNQIVSNLSVSYGYFSLLGAIESNVVVQGGSVDVQHHAMFMTDFNEGVTDDDERLIFDGVEFSVRRPILLRDSRNITIRNSVIPEVIQERCQNIVLEDNTEG